MTDDTDGRAEASAATPRCYTMDFPAEELAADLECLGSEWDAFDRRAGTLKAKQYGGGDVMVRRAATKLRAQAAEITRLRAELAAFRSENAELARTLEAVNASEERACAELAASAEALERAASEFGNATTFVTDKWIADALNEDQALCAAAAKRAREAGR